MVSFSLPMLAGSVLQTAYSFVNAIWVGQYLGTNSLAAVTVSFPVVFTLMALAAGLTMASNILVSQAFGAKNHAEVRRVADTSVVLVNGVSLVLLAIGELFAGPVLRAMDTPADVLPLAVGYLQIFLFSLPLVFGLFLTRSLLQGIGDAKTPLIFSGASVVLAAVLDPVLMFGWFGMPALGLNGTAYATVIAQCLCLGGLLVYLRRRGNPVAPAWPKWEGMGETALKILRIGIPSSVQQSLVSIGMVFVTGIVNGFGETATAAFGAASRIDQIVFMPAMTFGMAISTLAGQNIGAKKHDRVREIFRWGALYSGGVTLIGSLLAVAFPEALLRIFVRESVVIEQGAIYLRTVGSCYVFFALTFVSNGIINGAGHTLMTTLSALISLWVIRVPVAYFLSHRMGSVHGVWYAISLSFIVSLMVSMAYYLTGSWKRSWRKPREAILPTGTALEAFGTETGEA